MAFNASGGAPNEKWPGARAEPPNSRSVALRSAAAGGSAPLLAKLPSLLASDDLVAVGVGGIDVL